jgi:DNA-binding CsgD family transcriptional regulator
LASGEAIGDGVLLSSNAEVAFGLISAGRDVPAELEDAVTELVELGFVVRNSDGKNRPVSLDPWVVVQRQTEQMLLEAQERIQKARALPLVADRMVEAYRRGQWRSSGGAEYIEDKAVVNARLDDVIASAEVEILSAQPGGPRTQEQLERSLARDTAALERGVAKRTLYRVVARDNACTAEYVRAMTARESGRRPEYRTLGSEFERAIVVDQRVAFISNHYLEGAPEHAAWVVTDRAMVAYITAEFDARWRAADPWHGELRGRGQTVDTITGADGVRTTRRQRQIMRYWVDGMDQRAIAAKLGVSERTIAAEFTALRDAFDATSQAQLAYQWAFSSDRLVDDSAPEAGLARPRPAAA